jgi:hypothetical protein
MDSVLRNAIRAHPDSISLARIVFDLLEDELGFFSGVCGLRLAIIPGPE